MERPAPYPIARRSEQKARPVEHFLSRFSGKRQQEEILGRQTRFDQPGDTVDQGAGLSASGAGDHQNGTVQGADSGILRRVKFFFVIDREAG
jgi:hypothetical protein